MGGASELYKVTPDLAAFGKGMGNGLPISAVAGRKEILKLIEEGIFISTTYGGESLSMAGALESINIMEQPGTYDKIWSLGSALSEGLKGLITKYNLSRVLNLSGLAPHCGLEFEGHRSLDYLDINSLFSQTMVEEGILTVGINNFNLSHTMKEITLYLEAAEKAMAKINLALENDTTEGLLNGKKINPVFKRNIK